MTQPIHTSPMGSHRFHFLDGLRGLAAILVVLYHVPFPYRTRLPLHQAWLAVDFFFLLSGFVIAFSYEQRLSAGMRLRDFTVARLIRLYPLYIVGTLLGVISVVIVDSLSKHVRLPVANLAQSLPFALLLIPNFLNHWPAPYCFPFDLPAWSLFLEIAVNIFFAFLVRRRFGNLAVLVIAILTSLIILVANTRSGIASLDNGSLLSSLPLAVPRAGFSFFTGILVFRFYKSRPAPAHKALRTWLFPIGSAVGLAFALMASFSLASALAYQLFVVALVFPVLVFFSACSQLPAFGNRVCAFLGDISYPLYILHEPLVAPLDGSKPLAFLKLHPTAAPWLMPALLIFLITIAWLAARYPDRIIRLWLTRHYNAATI